MKHAELILGHLQDMQAIAVHVTALVADAKKAVESEGQTWPMSLDFTRSDDWEAASAARSDIMTPVEQFRELMAAVDRVAVKA